MVSELQNDAPLEFRIRALALPGTPQLVAGRDDALQNGEEVLSSIPLGSFATFPLQVDDAGAVRVSVGETVGTSAGVFLQVFDTDGSLVGSDSGNSDAVVQFTTLETGTFTAVVSELQNDAPLEFQIVATGISDQPTSVLLGDVNEDGAVDFLDISPFISVLSAGGSQVEADVNQDGSVNFLDISPFILLLSTQGSGSSAAFSASLEPANDEPVDQLSISSSNSSRRISEGISVQLVQSPSEPLLSSSGVTGTELRAGISGPSPLAFVSGGQVQGADDSRDLGIEQPVSNSALPEVPNDTGNETSSQPDGSAVLISGATSSSDLFDAHPDLLDGLADPQLDDVLASLLV